MYNTSTSAAVEGAKEHTRYVKDKSQGHAIPELALPPPTKGVPTLSKLERDIDRWEIQLRECNKALAGLRFDTEFDAEAVVAFQERLARVLFEISDRYMSAAARRRKLVSEKANRNPERLLREFRSLQKQQDALDELAKICKAMGDAFAWFFYQKSPDLLHEHFAHPSNAYTPPGAGGIGKLAFVTSVKNIGGYMTLYHGITSMLRKGDVSLVDLKSFRVVGLGEPKSSRETDGRVSITFHALVVGPEPPTNDQQIHAEPTIWKGHEAKLKRQMLGIRKMYAKKPSLGGAEIESETYADKLNIACAQATEERASVVQAGQGLLLIVLRSARRSLSRKLLGPPPKRLSSKFGDVVAHVGAILDQEEAGTPDNANSIHMGSVARYWVPGMIPLLSFPADFNFVTQILFYDLLTITIYNPVHLIKKLRKAGFVVEISGRDWKVLHEDGQRRLQMMGGQYMTQLVFNGLLSEDFIFTYYNTMREGALSLNLQHSAIIQPVFHQGWRFRKPSPEEMEH